ncbi:antibiotic biosynthesis monooxygenase [Microbacterium sp. ARD31]|uniref:antibiotic biosynthesis monooxygenase family protein n=1 Tax=Microbacterium sp. ARD31 TaxID=2962576 RepID=UPI002882A92F|nr:antibiotic biosynthesis monooxygenase [Microbacterium sp. ARD31]MDT0183961.1 antibiotic biosynthesis monooxygenase [Microbacterium sp. ARD31]
MTTMINPFIVDAADQAELVAIEVTGITEIASAMPGFVRGSIHRSLDGTRVVNYIQWADGDSWANAHSALTHDERYRAHMARVQRIATANPHAYEVVAVIEGRSPKS